MEVGLIRAAGTLLWRPGPDGPEIALVRRVRYQDWSLPKGKLEPAEHAVVAAVREVREETGQQVALGRPLPTQVYEVLGVPKEVRYWAARGDTRPFVPTPEIEDVVWLAPEPAKAQLSYAHDAEVVDAFLAGPADTVPLVVLRHAKAVKRGAWSHPDDEIRPLDARGTADAYALPPLLAAFGIERVHSSDSLRCMHTVAPYAHSRGVPVLAEPLLSEPGFDHGRRQSLGRVDELLREPAPLVLCTHRPALPALLRRLLDGSEFGPPVVPLEPGALLVLHRDRARLDDPDTNPVVAVERHRP